MAICENRWKGVGFQQQKFVERFSCTLLLFFLQKKDKNKSNNNNTFLWLNRIQGKKPTNATDYSIKL